MKYYTLYRENNNFDDIIKDKSLKNKLHFKIRFYQHLIVGFENEEDDKILGYIVLKYGDDIKNLFEKDFTPIPYKDYIPKRTSNR